MSETPAEQYDSVWAQYLAERGLPPDTPMPTQLDAYRASAHPDGLRHCTRCGGTLFTATVVLSAAGQPVAALKPQTCVGCGALNQQQWPPT